MLILKTIGLVILFAVITWVVAEFLINAIMLAWVYPYALSFVVVFLEDKGRGYFEAPNEQAQGYNIIIRVFANAVLYIVGIILIFLLIPHGAIQLGCLIGWFTNGFFAVQYEFCLIPRIGRFDHFEDETNEGDKRAVFKQLDGEEFSLSMEPWGAEDYPEESYRYVVMDAFNYQAFFQLI